MRKQEEKKSFARIAVRTKKIAASTFCSQKYGRKLGVGRLQRKEENLEWKGNSAGKTNRKKSNLPILA